MPSFLLPPRMVESEAVSKNIQFAGHRSCSAILLIAKSAFAAAPHQEMQRLAELAASLRPGALVRFAFTEQGTPSLHEALVAMVDEDLDDLVVVPLVLPMEPSFHNWLKKSLARWQATDPRPWPALSIASDIASSPLMAQLLEELSETPGSRVRRWRLQFGRR